MPTGQTALTPVASSSGSSVSYSVVVAYDVVHTGTVTLTYGAVQRAYPWADGTLTAQHIYSAVAYTPGATWARQAPTWQPPVRGLYGPGSDPSHLSYSSDLTTLTVVAPSCNDCYFYATEFVYHSFVGDFTLVVKFTNQVRLSVFPISSPTISPSSILDFTIKNEDNSTLPQYPWLRDGSWYKPGYARNDVTDGTFTRYSPVAAISGDAVLGTFYLRVTRQGTSLTADVSGDNVTYYSSSSGTSFASAIGGFGTTECTIPIGDKLMLGFNFSPYTTTIFGTPNTAPLRSIQLSCPFTQPTACTFSPTSISRGVKTSVLVAMNVYDARVSSTCEVYTVQAGTYARVGTGLLQPTGTADVPCTFWKAGTFSLAFVVTSGAGRATGYITCGDVTITESAHVYAFPGAFTYDGTTNGYKTGLVANGYAAGIHLKQGTSGTLTLAFTGGDGLHSSVAATQVAYVTFSQTGQTGGDTTIGPGSLSCSDERDTITIASITPTSTAALTLKVQLRGPDGAPGTELTATIPSSAIAPMAPSWVPTATGSVTSNLVLPHKLAYLRPAALTCSFVSSEDFPAGEIITGLLINGKCIGIAYATVNRTARTFSFSLQCITNKSSVFEIFTKYGPPYVFVVREVEVYTFPTMTSITRNPSVVGLGQVIELTANFSATLPKAMTADVYISAFPYTITGNTRVSGSTATLSFVVDYDVTHTGEILLRYGTANEVTELYTWPQGTLTGDHIVYTLPSSFTFSGASNGYGAGIHLKVGLPGSLTLTFTGGDRLHSSVVASQVAYVQFAQTGETTTIDPAYLTCSDELDTITIASITPTSMADLTLKVKLRRPVGQLGSELTAIIPIDSALDSPFWPAGVTFTTPLTSPGCNLLWSYASTPIQNGIADYWKKYVDLSMYTWQNNTPITASNVLSQFGPGSGKLYPKFTPAYYATGWPEGWAHNMMTPDRSTRASYFFMPSVDFRWGYSVPTYANRIALCLDAAAGVSGVGTRFFDFHYETTWRLWGYPNKNYNEEERTLLGTFTIANFTRSPVGTYKWNQLSWPSGARFTHYLWQPSRYDGPRENFNDISNNSCPPILGM